MMKLSSELADDLYNILIAFCEASPDMRQNFVHSMTERQAPHEYRFQGKLGFGGKLRTRLEYVRVNSEVTQTMTVRQDLFATVDCYPEDSTPELRLLIARVNALLAIVVEKYA
jgi:hypothetical protein